MLPIPKRQGIGRLFGMGLNGRWEVGPGAGKMLSICYSTDVGTDWVIKRVVGVVRLSKDDLELHITATIHTLKVSAYGDFYIEIPQ